MRPGHTVILTALFAAIFLYSLPDASWAQTTSAPANKCDPNDIASGTALSAKDIAGKWTDATTHDEVEIKPASAGDTTHFTLSGKHDWDGVFDNGKLIFRRKPKAPEMDHNAPDAARAAVEGKLEWRMELSPRLVCGTPVLHGPWYPGRIRIPDKDGKLDGADATLAGDGTPITMHFGRILPAIYGVIELTDQTAMVTDGYPAHPYPFPEPPLKEVPSGAKIQPMEAKPFLNARAANGRSYASGERRMLYVYGQGLPRKYDKKITFTGGAGATGLEYSIEALSGASDLSETDKKYLSDGRMATLKDIQDLPMREILQNADAMIVRVDLRSGVLPGWKDFKINDDIRGNSRWELRFGDDQAIVSFARDTAYGESELTDTGFMPERMFIMVRTQTALPVDEIKLRVAVNDARVKWNGDDTITAKRDPNDPTKTTYRTATIELVDPKNPRGPADPGVVFLPVSSNDKLIAWPEDPGLLRAECRKLKVLRTPSALGMTWKEALMKAAKATQPEVPASIHDAKDIESALHAGDWSALSSSQAAEVSNLMVMDLFAESPTLAGKMYKGIRNWYINRFGGGNTAHNDGVQKVSVKIGDLAALLMFRDEFVHRMDADLRDPDKIPSLSDPVAMRGLRKKLQPFAWDPNSAWTHIYITCPDGGSCPIAKALDDDYITKQFKDKPGAADNWIVSAMREAVKNYTNEITSAKKKAEDLADNDAKGLLNLLGADCAADVGDYPCGYMALRQFILPRMMRLRDYDSPQRYMWVADLNARFTLRNLNTLIAAVKSQKAASSADTDVAVALGSLAMGPVLSTAGVYGEMAAAALEAPGANTLISMATEVPDLWRSYQELKFARGASLVLGTERLTDADIKMTQAVSSMASSIASSLGQELPGMLRVTAEVRTARILAQVEQGGFKSLPVEDQHAFWRMAFEAEKLKSVSKLDQTLEFDKRISTEANKIMAEGGNSESPAPANNGGKGSGGNSEPPAPPGNSGEGHSGIPPTDSPGKGAGTPTSDVPLTNSETTARTGPGDTVKADGDTTVEFEKANAKSETVDVAKAEETPVPPEEKASASDETKDVADKGDAKEKEKTAQYEQAEKPKPKLSAKTLEGMGSQVPQAGKQYNIPIDGEIVTLTLGERVGGKSATAQVWSIEGVSNSAKLPGCAKPGTCVIKLYGGSKDVLRISLSSQMLGETSILQPKTMMTAADAPHAFIIQEKLTPSKDLVMFRNRNEFLAHPDHVAMGDELINRFAEIKEAGLGWSDGKIDNVYWKREGGQWKLGTFDPDFVGPWAERSSDVGLQMSFVEADPTHLESVRQSLSRHLEHMRDIINDAWAHQKFHEDFKNLPQSMQDKFNANEDLHWQFFEKNRGPYTASPEHFMEGMFEDRGWIKCCDSKGNFIDGMLSADQIRKRFPKFGLRDQLAPTDAISSFYVPENNIRTAPTEPMPPTVDPLRTAPTQPLTQPSGGAR
jgi:hypothetical protein